MPLVSCDPLGRFMEDWVAWAGQVTVRRLREDVEWALTLEQTDPAAFRRSGGLPAEARGEREIGAVPRDHEEDTVPPRDQEIGLNLDAEPARSPHPLPLRPGLGRPGELHLLSHTVPGTSRSPTAARMSSRAARMRSRCVRKDSTQIRHRKRPWATVPVR